MKEIILKYIEYLERKRKSRDLWKLLQEEKKYSDFCISQAEVWRTQDDWNQYDCWQDHFRESGQRVEKLKNQIKLL